MGPITNYNKCRYVPRVFSFIVGLFAIAASASSLHHDPAVLFRSGAAAKQQHQHLSTTDILPSLPSNPQIRSGISSASVLIVIAGSVARNDSIEALTSIYSAHFPVLAVTEESHTQCVLCSNGSRFARNTFHHSPRHGRSKFANRGTGWHCFQQRYMQALRSAIHIASSLSSEPSSSSHQSAATGTNGTSTTDAPSDASDNNKHASPLRGPSPISWIVMTEDDSVINMAGLMRLMKTETERVGEGEPVAMGCDNRGGGGFIFNRAAIDMFQSPIGLLQKYSWQSARREWVPSPQVSVVDTCLRLQLGGPWCLVHSDWAVDMCAQLAGLRLDCIPDKMHQPNTYDPTSPSLDAWVRGMVSTHHHTSPEKIRALAKDIAKHDPF